MPMLLYMLCLCCLLKIKDSWFLFPENHGKDQFTGAWYSIEILWLGYMIWYLPLSSPCICHQWQHATWSVLHVMTQCFTNPCCCWVAIAKGSSFCRWDFHTHVLVWKLIDSNHKVTLSPCWAIVQFKPFSDNKDTRSTIHDAKGYPTT